MSNEIELKLLVRAEDRPKVESLLKKKATSANGRSRQLVSAYFDTPDFQLWQRGIILRVRSEDHHYVQCVKSKGRRIGGVMVRGEWENPVPTGDPMLAAIDDEDLRRLATPADQQPLREIFRTEVQRTSHEMTIGGSAQVTMDLDVGQIVCNGESEPVTELELELLSGDPKQLYDLALDFNKTAPLRVSTQSKSARGYALASGQGPVWSKDPGLDLSGDATVEGALAHTVQHCLDHMQANEACVMLSDHPEGVHQMRVAMRRLRSALRLFRTVVPAEQYDWLVGELRWLTSALGPARDWDVFLEDIVDPVAKPFPDDADFAALRAAVDEMRERHRAAARDAVASRRYTDMLLGFGSWIARAAWRHPVEGPPSPLLDGPIRAISDALLAKRHKKVRKSGLRFAEMTPEERHQMRIDVKKLRYASGFFGSLYPGKGVKPYAARLAALQDSLGYLNDVVVARQLVEQLVDIADDAARPGRQRVGGIIVGWHTHAMVQSQPALADDVAAFIDCPPFWTED